MSDYGGVSVFSEALPLVDDGVPDNGSDFNTPLEALADRTRWLKNRVGVYRLIDVRAVAGDVLAGATCTVAGGGTHTTTTPMVSSATGYTTLAANFTQPPFNGTVTAQVGSTAAMGPTGRQVWVPGGGLYNYLTTVDGTHAVLQNASLSNPGSGTTVTGGVDIFPAVFVVEPGDLVELQLSCTLVLGGATPGQSSNITASVGFKDSQNAGALTLVPGARMSQFDANEIETAIQSNFVFRPVSKRGFRTIATEGGYAASLVLTVTGDVGYSAEVHDYAMSYRVYRLFAGDP